MSVHEFFVCYECHNWYLDEESCNTHMLNCLIEQDLSAHEKSETLKLTKDAEELKSQNTDLTKQNDKFKNENETLEATINELQEQVDAALGMELIFLLLLLF